MLVANARMYTVDAATDGAWRALLAWVARAADVPLRYEAHAAPLPLPALWSRDDLGCVLMCGYPLATQAASASRPHALAAVVPRGVEAHGRAMYRTAIVVRSESAWTHVDALRGRRFAYTTPGSQSGYQAVRGWLAQRALAAGGRYFGATVGPLVTPRGVVDALLRDEADAGPLDGYWLQLLRLHEPAIAARLRVIDWTAWSPLPPFVCSAAVPDAVRERVRHALVQAGQHEDVADTREALAIARIASAQLDDYRGLAQAAAATDALGYPSLQ